MSDRPRQHYGGVRGSATEGDDYAARRKAIWLVGIVVSLLLATVPPLIDPKYSYIQVGILVGLAGICVALLVEQALRADQTAATIERELDRSSRNAIEAVSMLAPLISASGPCQTFVRDVVRQWRRVDQNDIPIFRDILEHFSHEFVGRLTELAGGSIAVTIDGPNGFRSRSFAGISSYRTISVGSLDFWNTPFGLRYLREQQRCIQEHGLLVDRIIVVDQPDEEQARVVAELQEEAGVRTSIVFRRWVADQHQVHLADQGIVAYSDGRKLLMRPTSTPPRRYADLERLSTVPAELAASEFSISVVRAYARTVAEVYGT
jgi:hypothetical protein